MSPEYKKIILDGLWHNNPALVQLLGLCPLLAVTGSVVNAIGLGLATTVVLVGSNLTVSLFRRLVPEAVRLPIFVMIIAAFVTAIELLMQALTYELYLILGIFIPLIVTNCAIMGRADAFASRNPVPAAVTDGLMMGVGFTLVLMLLGAMREALGAGTLFSNMHLLFGDLARSWEITLIEDYRGFLFAALPPGAFVGMGLLIALKNIIDTKLKTRAERNQVENAAPVSTKRVRITG
ncbi:electron transporter RnfE [Nitrincola sp. A-D6]|uniref:electron transport complex subunit E n=1 Tax=Nitrincola sp. A-D6 TaxID=1545442 RepID=UPI00051FD760|nr:electron transport complex subunit E [Nitrincola sp. A-D6]KGK42127.1 electron transporter RnfE [Nitrincola sp. A-D6]